MQLAAANDAETGRERYMAIISAKTAALFAAAAKAGAVAAGALFRVLSGWLVF